MSGYKGSSKVSSPDINFRKNIVKMAEQSEVIANSMLNGEVRVWELANHEKKNPCDHVSVRQTFSRSMLDGQYQSVYSSGSPGTDGDAKVIKLQAAYLQSMERAFRLRHCSLVRAEAFASGRRKGQGSGNGPLLTPYGVKGYIERLIKLSASTGG